MKFKKNASETQDREVREGGVKGKGRKYAGGGTCIGHAQQDFGKGSTGNEGSARGKGSTGMWNETQAKQQSLAGK